MKGLIILEGPDGAGKTTLAKMLCRMFNGHYMHMTYRMKDHMWLYHTAMLKLACERSTKQLVVLDRCWLSEAVYAEVYRGGSKWPHMGRMMDRVVRKHAGIYVLCYARTAYNHMTRFRELAEKREEMYKPDENMEKVWALYSALWSGVPGIKPGASYYEDILADHGMMNRHDSLRYSIEVEGESASTTAKFIERLVKRLTEYRATQTPIGLDHTFHNFLGHARKAKYLFVGDKLSEKKHKHLGWPFYAYQNSSLFLSEQLSAMGFNEASACWTNINGEHGKKVVPYLIEEYDLQPIFLGWEAIQAVGGYQLNGKKPLMIRHPQYYARWERHTGQFIKDLQKEFDSADGK